MADPLAQLPADDESPKVLLEDAIEYMRANVEGWQPSSGSPDYGFLAAGADEDAVQYALLRARADDWARDFGAVYDIPDPQPVPATTTTAWTARAGRAGTLTAGTSLVIDAPQGLRAFEVVVTTEIPASGTVGGILVQAREAGEASNGATGEVLLDQVPAWVASIAVEQPAAGGSEGATDSEHLETIKRKARRQHDAVVHADDLELAVLDVPGVGRALVRDNFDLDTDEDDVEGVCSVWALDLAGESISDPDDARLVQITELVAGVGRRILNGVIKFGAAEYTTVDVEVTVAPVDGHDEGAIEAGLAAAKNLALSPALHGQPALGENRRWRLRRKVRHYKIADALDDVDGVDEILDLTLSTSGPGTVNADGDVELAGQAPLPRPGTITVTYASSS